MLTTAALDPSCFPGRRTGEHRFDAPGGTLVHREVAAAMVEHLAGPGVANDHGAFAASAVSDGVVARANTAFRALVGATGGHVVFGPNMTQLTTMFVRAIAASIAPGDQIVCTELDHEANVMPWRALAAARGATVRTARVRQDGVLPVDAVTDLLGPRTRWVAVTAASNALGTVPELAAIAAAARAGGARTFVDGVQAVAHVPLNLDTIGCDAFVTSPYKWYGPHAGVLWLGPGVADDAHVPEQVASAGIELPGRLTLGTTNFEALLGVAVAAEILGGSDRVALAVRERDLFVAAAQRLAAVPGVRLFGPPADAADRVPVLAFRVGDHPAQAVASALATRGVAVWDGTFYASAAVAAVSPEVPDLVRAGIAAYTDEADVEALGDAVAAVAAGSV